MRQWIPIGSYQLLSLVINIIPYYFAEASGSKGVMLRTLEHIIPLERQDKAFQN